MWVLDDLIQNGLRVRVTKRQIGSMIGETKGRGKLGPAGKQSVSIKDIWLYPRVDTSGDN